MRRKDRELKDPCEILEVLKKCDTLSIGLNGKDYPYVVPVSFGVLREDSSVTVYFHGAKQGQKVDMLENDPRACVEGHVFYKVEPTQGGITTRYESVIGFGVVERVEGAEALAGLHSIADHYISPAYPIDSCQGLPATAVYKIKLEGLTGKRNLP